MSQSSVRLSKTKQEVYFSFRVGVKNGLGIHLCRSGIMEILSLLWRQSRENARNNEDFCCVALTEAAKTIGLTFLTWSTKIRGDAGGKQEISFIRPIPLNQKQFCRLWRHDHQSAADIIQYNITWYSAIYIKLYNYINLHSVLWYVMLHMIW